MASHAYLNGTLASLRSAARWPAPAAWPSHPRLDRPRGRGRLRRLRVSESTGLSGRDSRLSRARRGDNFRDVYQPEPRRHLFLFKCRGRGGADILASTSLPGFRYPRGPLPPRCFLRGLSRPFCFFHDEHWRRYHGAPLAGSRYPAGLFSGHAEGIAGVARCHLGLGGRAGGGFRGILFRRGLPEFGEKNPIKGC